jgi:hypothetical protein
MKKLIKMTLTLFLLSVQSPAKPSDGLQTFSRTSFKALKEKKSKKEPMVVHIFVPLCDNVHQGIVPVSKSLGDGMNLRTNLYWGALYGVKTHFKRSKYWKLISSEKDISEVVLERVIFKRGNTYVVADAYRGDKMKEALLDYFNSISGRKNGEVKVDNKILFLYKDADLSILNGHNGLMDYKVGLVESKDDKVRETMVIGCKSYVYFEKHFKSAKAYPLVSTTNFMAPEAYVLEAIINSWANLNSSAKMKKSAGKAYNKYQKCGLKGATRLFRNGWKKN